MKNKDFVLLEMPINFLVSESLGRLTYFIKGFIILILHLQKRENFSQYPANKDTVTGISKKLIHGTKLYFYNASEHYSTILLVCFLNPLHLNIFMSF